MKNIPLLSCFASLSCLLYNIFIAPETFYSFPQFCWFRKMFLSRSWESPPVQLFKKQKFVRVISVNIRLSYSNVSQFISSNFLQMRVLWANCWKEGRLCSIVPFRIKHKRFLKNWNRYFAFSIFFFCNLFNFMLIFCN